jgi:nitrate reductase beta subunit
MGIVLYDADRVEAAASTPDEKDLLEAQLDLFLDPFDPEVCEAARADGIAEDWLDAARRSPVYALAVKHRVALPLHPEFRTLPMVWYVPPLSPVMSMIEGEGSEADPDDVFPAIDDLRIPIAYLANMLTAGDEEPVRLALKRLAAMRAIMRERNLGAEADEATAAAVGLELPELEQLYRLLAIAHSHDRYVIPKGHAETVGPLAAGQGSGGFPQSMQQGAGSSGSSSFVPLSKLGRVGG